MAEVASSAGRVGTGGGVCFVGWLMQESLTRWPDEVGRNDGCC